jgi:hypothetical protein
VEYYSFVGSREESPVDDCGNRSVEMLYEKRASRLPLSVVVVAVVVVQFMPEALEAALVVRIVTYSADTLPE